MQKRKLFRLSFSSERKKFEKLISDRFSSRNTFIVYGTFECTIEKEKSHCYFTSFLASRMLFQKSKLILELTRRESLIKINFPFFFYTRFSHLKSFVLRTIFFRIFYLYVMTISNR